MAPVILWLGEPSCHRPPMAGGKAAPLSRIAADFNVPRGFVVSVAAFDRWAQPEGGAPPPEFFAAIASAYNRLCADSGTTQLPVAVRSSAVDEDGAGASFAGQHDTYLGVNGAAAVANAVVRCWDSIRSEPALEYRRRRGFVLAGARMAVLVQHMVTADASGVAFSANPVTGSRDEVVINCTFGLGEGVVGGTVTPDMLVLDRRSGIVTTREIAEKRTQTVIAEGGTTEVGLPSARAREPSLSDEEAGQVARLAAQLESTFGFPVDIEFAFEHGELYLLQCRPITTPGS